MNRGKTAVNSPSRRRLTIGFSTAAIAALALAGCAQPEEGDTGSGDGELDQATCSATGLGCDPELVQAAKDAALAAADGNAELGGEITMLSGGTEEYFTNMFAPFEEATGVTMTITEVPGAISVLAPQVASGNAPDVLYDSTLGYIEEFGSYLQPIDDILGEEVIAESINPTLAEFASVDGRLYAVPINTQTFTTYYRPGLYEGPTDEPTWQELLDWGVENPSEDRALFCITTNDGGFSGNKETQFLDTLLLREHGPELLTALTEGTQKWNSPEVKETLNHYLDVYRLELNYGGLDVALTTPEDDAPAQFSDDPAKCELNNNGPWMGSLIQNVRPGSEEGVDYAHFFLGAENEEYTAAKAMSHNGGGHLFTFERTPQTEALNRYMASDEFATLLASTGNLVMMNQQVDPAVYPTETMSDIAAHVTDTEQLVVSPFGGLPPSIRDIYVASIFGAIQDPSTVDQQLQAIDDAVAAYSPTE